MRNIQIVHFASDKSEFTKVEKALQEIEGTELLAQFTSNIQQAYDFVSMHKPLLVLADIDMPKGILFVNMIKKIKHIHILALVTKSTSQYEAVVSSSLPYIEKPVTSSVLEEEIVDLFNEHVPAKESNHHFSDTIPAFIQYPPMNTERKYPARIFINNVHRTKVLHIKDILYITSNGPYSEFTTIDGEKHKASKSLKSYEEELNNHPDFARIHRCSIVNKNFIRTIQRNKNEIRVEMSNGALLNIARAKKEEIFQMLAW